MAKETKYENMLYSELKGLYIKRCEIMGIENPSVPRKKEDLITMLGTADTFGIPKNKSISPEKLIRNTIVGILESSIKESKKSGRKEPTILIS